MGISEREYQEWLRRNDQLHVRDDGRPRGPAHQPHAAYRLTEAAHPAPTEHEEQVALFEWADAQVIALPELMTLFAIPNGGARHPAVAAQMKAEGLRAGVPDIFLPAMRRGEDGRTWGGLFVEMKRADKSNGPTPEQREWIAALRESGYMCVVAYGADEAIQTITHYLSLEGGYE